MSEFEVLFKKPLDLPRLRSLARRTRSYIEGPQPLSAYNTPRSIEHQLPFHTIAAQCGLSKRMLQCVSIVLNYFGYLTAIPRNRGKIDIQSQTVSPIRMAVRSNLIMRRIHEHGLVFEKETLLKWDRDLDAAQQEGPDAYAKALARYEVSLGSATNKILYCSVLNFLEATHVITRANNGNYEPHRCSMAYYFDRGAATNCHDWLVRVGVLTKNAAKNKVFGTFSDEEMAEGYAWCARAGERNAAFKQHMNELVGLCVIGKPCKISMDNVLDRLLKGNQKVAEWAIWACIQKYFYDNHPELRLIQENIEEINKSEPLESLHLHGQIKLKHAKGPGKGEPLVVGASFRVTSEYAYSKEGRERALAEIGSKEAFNVDMLACRFSLCYLCVNGKWPESDLYEAINAEAGGMPFASKKDRDRFKKDVNIAVSCYDLQGAAWAYCRAKHIGQDKAGDVAAERLSYLERLHRAVSSACGGIPDNTYYPLESFFMTTAHLYLLRHGIEHVGYVYDGLHIFKCEACSDAEKAHQLFKEALEFARQQFVAKGLDKAYRERFAESTCYELPTS